MPPHQGIKGWRRLGFERRGLGPHGLPKPGEDLGIQGIGCGQRTGRFRKGMRLPGIEHGDRQPRGYQRGHDGTFERAGHLRNIEPLVDTYDISLVKSFIISNDMQDIQMGRQLNCKTILLERPKQGERTIQTLIGPHYTAENFQEVTERILSF